ncbi:leucyl aminopeptidase [Chloroflexota bacterium]
MEIGVVSGDIVGAAADAVILPVFEGAEALAGDIAAVDKALSGAVSGLMAQGEIKGKLNEITVVHTLGKLPASRVVMVGLGKPPEITPEKVRGAMAKACRRLQKMGVKTAATAALGAGSHGINRETAAQAVTEGALLGVYSFRKHITKEAEHGEIQKLTIIDTDKANLPLLEQGSNKGRILAGAANLCRDMVNEPANYMTPAHMAAVATGLAGTYGLEIDILEEAQMEKMGMGAMLGVTQGSRQPPKFIVLRYGGSSSTGIDMALLGKGITFDSGGISIKPSSKMEEMKGDMSGGAAVMAAMSAIAQLKPELNVMAVIPCAENLPGGSSLKPGDVLKAMDGKTIEVISTDAEGRLILADALGYARKLNARAIIDVATLTGACVVALGEVCTGAFTNNQELVDKVITAGDDSGELIWQMPMYEQYKEQNKSDVADIKNVGGRYGGAITAAQFLAEFAGDTPWVHLDIAGTNMTDKERGYLVKGATGVPVRTLVNLVLSLAK